MCWRPTRETAALTEVLLLKLALRQARDLEKVHAQALALEHA